MYTLALTHLFKSIYVNELNMSEEYGKMLILCFRSYLYRYVFVVAQVQ